VKGLGAYLRYKLGVLDIEAWTKNMMLQFKGQSERALTREANIWFREMVEATIYPEGERLLREHRERGHVVSIVSGATRFVVKPLAQRLDVKHFLYTRLEVEDGRFTGRVVEPICFEEGKIYWLQQFIEEQGIDLAKSWFYTEELVLYGLDHGHAAAGAVRPPGCGEPRSAPVPDRRASPLARPLLRAPDDGGQLTPAPA
jgi:putative phosphoserine phosphatase/1-acylglycerol-3-phosphate O-acyltransferase